MTSLEDTINDWEGEPLARVLAASLALILPDKTATLTQPAEPPWTDAGEQPMSTDGWFSAETDEPRDQQRDLYSPYWALIGPDSADGWDWSVIDGRDSETAASGNVADETAAKRAVNDWETANPAPPLTLTEQAELMEQADMRSYFGAFTRTHDH